MSSAIVPVSSKVYSTDNITLNILKNSNCWIDFSDDTKYTTTGTGNLVLSSVTDKSNDARTITISGSPRFDEASKSMFNITAATGNFLSVNTGGPTSTSRSETVFVVFTPAIASSSPGLFGSSTTGSRYCRYGPNLGYGLQGSGPLATASNLTLGQLVIGTFVCDNGSTNIYINGKQDAAGNTNFTATATTTQIGRAGNTTYVMYGNLHEIIFFNSAIADDQRQLIEYYLMNKWKLSVSISSPLSFTGCTLWLDAADANTMTYSSGTSVSQWADKSGNNYHAVQATSTRQPTYNSSNKTLTFANVNNQFMISPAPFSSANETLYVVLSHNNFANVTFLGNTDSTSGGRQLRINSGRVNIYNGATLAINGIRTGIPTATPFLFEFVNVNGRCLVNLNKAVDGNTGRQGFASGTFTQVIGARHAGGSPWDGNIYEVIIFNRALTGSERFSITNYLFNKWNIAPGTLLNSYHTYVTVPPYLRLSIPIDVLGCELWLDAADKNTLTLSGSNVTQWNDKSGNANHASGGTSPTYTTNAVVFNGTTHYLTTPYSASLSIETFYFVGTLTGSTSAGDYHTIVASSANGGRHVFTGGTALFVNSQNVQAGPTGGTITANQITLFQYNRSLGNAISLLLNGNSIATGSLNAYTTGLTTWIGRWPGSTTQNWEGSIHEIIGYNRALSVGERQLIEGYLAQKWGLKSYLPSTHSFKIELALSPKFDLEKFFRLQIKLWLDASDPNGNRILPTVGASISQWTDKSGYNIHAINNSTVSSRPTFTYDGKYPAITFNKANSQFLNGSPLLTSANYGIFVVCRTTGGGLSSANCAFYNTRNNTAGSENYLALYPHYAPLPESPIVRFYNITYNNASPPNNYYKWNQPNNDSPNINDRYLMEIIDGPSSNVNCFFENGLAIGVNSYSAGGSAGTTDTTGYTLGRDRLRNPISYLEGYIYEIVVTNTQPTTSQRQQIEGYLSWKWGLQNKLPSTHAYAKYPPY